MNFAGGNSYRHGRAAKAGPALAAVACLAAAGCYFPGPSRLWADTALPDGLFSAARHQWAYDGEPVTFDLQCASTTGCYVIFGTDGDATVVSVPESEGHYRWTRSFSAGDGRRTYEVYAVPFVMRGKCDWVFDKARGSWTFYPGSGEAPDVQASSERRMRITCYRTELVMSFRAAAGPPRRVELALTSGGTRRTIPPMQEGKAGSGFTLVGPGRRGTYQVRYVPRYDEVSRAGVTHAELIIEHADGRIERLSETFDTP